MTNVFYVYVLFRDNGLPFYVGKGKGSRWLDHEREAKRGRSYKDNIICKMLAAGADLPKVKVAEGLSEPAAFELEVSLIKVLGRYPQGLLTNETDGGDGISNPSAKVRAKMRAAQLGKKRSPEQCKKNGDGKRGKPISEETKAKLRASSLGKKKSPSAVANMRAAITGRKLSKEHVDKMRATLTGMKRSEETVENIRRATLGHIVSAETRAKIAATLRRRHLEKLDRAAQKV